MGSNCTVNTAACPGFSVAGKLPPETENPVPVIEAELIVAGAVPLDVTVIDCVVAVPTETLPNESEALLKVSAGVVALSCSETILEVLAVVAVSVTDCAVVTEATLAVNAALVAVAGIVTELGTVTALLLLARLTVSPPVGAEPVRLTVQASASDPVMDVLLQETALTVGKTAVPVPLRLMVAVGALLEIVNCPATELAVLGLN